MDNDPKRFSELDILKALAISAVIFIHVISGSLAYLAKDTFSFNLTVVFDQFFRFSVPLFVALSGYTLAMRYKDQQINLLEFFKKRVLRILPWYFFWTLVIYFSLKFYFNEITVRLYPWWKIFFFGKADYHLYFVPMIFQLYLLFPVLLFLFKKLRWILLVVLLILQIAFYYILSLYFDKKITLPIELGDQQQYLFFGTWVFYFVLGIALLLVNDLPQKILRVLKLLSPLFIIGSFLLLVNTTFDAISKNFNLIIATRFTKISIVFYAASFIIFSIFYGRKLLVLPRFIVRILENFGKRSFVTYLCHTLVLRFLVEQLYLPTTLSRVLILGILTIIISDLIAFASIKTTSLFLRRD